MLIRLLLVTLPLLAAHPAAAQEGGGGDAARLYRIDAQSPQGLQDLFRATGEPLPLVSAHRGGAREGYPENCLATFEQTLRRTFAMLEVDPRLTKDGAIVLHHDATLERTTTGRGRVADFTLAELKQLRLKDSADNVTEYTIPTLDEALEWARGKTILVLDQKDVPVAARVRKIEERRAAAYAILIVYHYADVQACYAMNPQIMMEVMIPNRQKLAEFDKLGVPWRNVIAFVGHDPPTDRALYEAIHARGARCMIGASRNLDRRVLARQVLARQVLARSPADIRTLEPQYRAFLDRGADLIETDIPVQLGPLLFGEAEPPPSKKKYFHFP